MSQPVPASAQTPVSRDVVRAILTTRDNRHNEAHAMLVALFQSLVAELVEQGLLNPAPLAARLALADAAIQADVHGEPARDMLNHVVGWLNTMVPGLPPPHPERWTAPPMDR